MDLREVAEAVRRVPLDALVGPASTSDTAERALANVQHAALGLPLPRLAEACAGLRRAAASGL